MLNPVVAQLRDNSVAYRTHVCVGLDPDPTKLPEGFSPTVAGVSEFLKEVMAASAGLCIAFKPNISFFEALGIDGLKVLLDLRSSCPDTMPWIIDAKRGDIGNTSAMQARFIYDHLGADATTLHPYMGEDSVTPFFEYRSKLNFVLGLTSNPGSATFEKQRMAGAEALWERVIRQCQSWNRTFNNVGMVIGGTHSELAIARTMAPELPFLIPGVGAQGATYQDVMAASNESGSVSLINMSRSVLYCDNTPRFAESIRSELTRFQH